MSLHVRCSGFLGTVSCLKKSPPTFNAYPTRTCGAAHGGGGARPHGTSSQMLRSKAVTRPQIVSRRTASNITTPALPPHATFEPHLDPSALAAQLLVLSVTVGAAAYWWFITVPTARATLAKSKRKGEVGDYLKELNVADPSTRKAERWFYTDWINQLNKRQGLNAWGNAAATQAPQKIDAAANGSSAAPPTSPSNLDGPADDNLLRPSYETPTPRFFSLDNPLIAAGAFIGGAVLLSSVFHTP